LTDEGSKRIQLGLGTDVFAVERVNEGTRLRSIQQSGIVTMPLLD
jgi:hypothetical protein